jgi:hypothetical protein
MVTDMTNAHTCMVHYIFVRCLFYSSCPSLIQSLLPQIISYTLGQSLSTHSLENKNQSGLFNWLASKQTDSAGGT